jgi:hypothetical protein
MNTTMKPNPGTLLTVLAMLISVAKGQDVVTVCDLLKAPEKYNGRVIGIRGTYVTTEHGTYLKGEKCGMPEVQGFIWPSVVSIVGREDLFRARGRSVDSLVRVINEISAAIKEHGKIESRVGQREITITVIGLFETHDDLSSRPGDGFGHLNGAPGQVYVERAKDITIATH